MDLEFEALVVLLLVMVLMMRNEGLRGLRGCFLYMSWWSYPALAGKPRPISYRSVYV